MSDAISEHDSDSSGDEDVQDKKANQKISNENADWQRKLELDESGCYSYTDPQSGVKYRWSQEEQSWQQTTGSTTDDGDVVKSLRQQADTQAGLQPWEQYLKQHEQDKQRTYKDPTDGMEYFWDEQKRAWFPKVDDDFIAAYQANYGISNNEEEAKNNEKESNDDQSIENMDKQQDIKSSKEEEKDPVDSRKRKIEEKGWFDIDPEKNNNVYVSGLPTDFTDDEFIDLMTKCGIIMEHPDTKKLKCKLYRDKDGNFKGDGRCCYLRGESVTLALQLLDESEVKGQTIHVERAVFQLKGEYDPSKKPKKNKKKKKKAGQEKLLDWVDRDRKRSKFDRIVILKYMFNPGEFEDNPGAINEIRNDVKSECGKFGAVKKVLVFDRNPDGICSVCFVEPEYADECIEALNGRWFAGKRIVAERYDGVTQYHIQETEEQMQARLKQWEEFLNTGETENEAKTES